MKRILIYLHLFLLCCITLKGQDKEPALSVSGYASWLQNSMFDTIDGRWYNTSMLHNRVILKAFPSRAVSFDLEARNRLIIGDMVMLDPFYSESITSDPGWADLSWNFIDESSFLFNTMVDRAWICITSGKFELTAGRQRINWSQSLVWNPNDIFNTYSFFDFDYIERPGSDALRFVYSVTPSSAIETAVKMNHDGNLTAAALYRFNFSGTDLQFLAGETNEEDIVLGTGWSAAAGPYSIRGEATWFQPFEKKGLDNGTGIITVGIDRSFSEKFSAVTQLMYCNNPLTLAAFGDLYSGGLTAKELAFSKFTAIGQVTYTPMPLISVSGSAIWYPDLDGFFAGPSLDISLSEDIDFSFVWQHFRSTIAGERTRVNLGFLRFKYSF